MYLFSQRCAQQESHDDVTLRATVAEVELDPTSVVRNVARKVASCVRADAQTVTIVAINVEIGFLTLYVLESVQRTITVPCALTLKWLYVASTITHILNGWIDAVKSFRL